MNNEEKRRLLCSALYEKIMDASAAAGLVQTGMTIGCSGFVAVGHPKAVLREVARQGYAKDLRLLSGGGTGDEAVGELARSHAISFLCPYNNNPDARKQINSGEIEYIDMHLSRMPAAVRKGLFGKIDLAIIECCMVCEDGGIVPTLCIGASEAIVDCAESVILEINLTYPAELRGIHRLSGARDSIPCLPEKIAAVVFTDELGRLADEPTITPQEEEIAKNAVSLIKQELSAGRLPRPLAVEPGIGAVAVAVFTQMSHALKNEQIQYIGVVQDAAIDLMIQNRIDKVVGAALRLSQSGFEKLVAHLPSLRERLCILPQDESNRAENLENLQMAAVNTAIEADIWGNVNSTHLMGRCIMNGIGGSADFCRHSGLSIFMTPSTTKEGKISCIVPQVSNVDHTPYDVDILITEWGVADLRCKTPLQRAHSIITNCCHPDYRAALSAYLRHAQEASTNYYTARDLETAFIWHLRYATTGTMQE